jgi:CRISPR-associated endonuclease/helicase Cas3
MERADFAGFFAAVNDGRTPFRWQERLLDTILATGRWPDQIAAPTGAGKTSAIDVHVFAVALTAAGSPRLPRRLVMAVDRRVLVDDQYERARALSAALTMARRHRSDDVVAEAAWRLAALRWPSREEGRAWGGDESPLVTGRLRGGSVPSRSWRDYPSACAVLCATPDMWGSRLLFGGYGTPALAAPREAGLLAFDSAVMVDEAHLARQLVFTARRVARLTQAAEKPVSGVPALQVTEVTATPDTAAPASVVTVGEEDLAEDLLAARLTRPKPVALVPVPGWPTSGRAGKTAAAIAEQAALTAGQVRDQQGASRTVGCFVNTVPAAVAVAELLRSRPAGGQPLRVVLVCGQIRPADLARVHHEYPGLLTPAGSGQVDVIVATQSLEVGVDLDLAGIVTELAAGSALAQRAGRANRRGLRERAPVTIVIPAGPLAGTARSGPYTAAELGEALQWARRRAADPAGLAPWTLRNDPPPAATPRRRLYQRPELADAWHWARTSDNLAAEPELDLWLADSLDAETSVGILVRDAMPADPAEAVELARTIPPAPWEVFPVPYRTAREVLTGLLEEAASPRGAGAAASAGVRIRGEEITPLAARARADGSLSVAVRPGDLVMVDAAAKIFTPAPPDELFSPQVVVTAAADDPDSPGMASRSPAGDVLHRPPALRDGDLVLRLEAQPGQDQIAGISHDAVEVALSQLGDLAGLGERERRRQLAAVLRDLGSGYPDDSGVGQLISCTAGLLGDKRAADSDVTVQQAGEGVRVVVADRRRATADEDVRQVYTPASDMRVTLAAHQQAVGCRASTLAALSGLCPELTAALRLAGEHHDDGKADPRFQAVRLGAAGEPEPLAKSLPGTTVRQVREREGEGGLPAGWRHEQRSVADCWDEIHAQIEAGPLLVARLAGTSHGYGRSGFPHSSSGLRHDDDDGAWRDRAAMLFDEGGWDELIEVTQARYGVWGCAYLEALLRAADCQVSGEGR